MYCNWQKSLATRSRSLNGCWRFNYSFFSCTKTEHVKELTLFLESHSISLSAEKRPVQSRIVPASWLAKLRPPRTHVLHSITQTRLNRAFLPALPELQLVQSVRRRPPVFSCCRAGAFSAYQDHKSGASAHALAASSRSLVSSGF
jgi:hypothetical protein